MHKLYIKKKKNNSCAYQALNRLPENILESIELCIDNFSKNFTKRQMIACVKKVPI